MADARKLFEDAADEVPAVVEDPRAASALPQLVRAKDREHWPLSFAQQRLWFLEQLTPGQNTYNEFIAWEVTGALDVPTLKWALAQLFERHPALRTVYQVSGTEPFQRVEERAAALEIRVVETAAQQDQCVRDMVARPFSLETEPPVRALLVTHAHEHRLALAVHHVSVDRWSFQLLGRELWTLYGARIAAKDPGLPPLPVRYVDYAVWQREWLQGEVLDGQVRYWKDRLAGLNPLELPTDRPRPAVQGGKGAEFQFVLSPELTRRVKALARKEGATLYMTLLAAFKVLLSRYSGQDDVSVGALISGRTVAEVQDLVGFFVNTLVMRTDLSGGPDFREVLKRVKQTAVGAYQHQDVSFGKLVEALHPARDMSRTPFFQAMFVLQQDEEARAAEVPGVSVARYELDAGISKFDLTFYFLEEQGRLAGTVEYSTELFDEGTIARMSGHLAQLLEEVVAHPDKRIEELELLTDVERHRILGEWNDTAAEYPRDKCIHQLFEEQARTTPGAVAVEFEGKRLSYAELNRQADQVAHHLNGLGVGPEVRVGLCLERSTEMVVGLLGILKAGGAYVPLDPSYPKARLAYMLEDSKAAVVLSHSRLAQELPRTGAVVCCVDQLAPERVGVERPASAVSPQNLAYLIYTSGSTGMPKGVGVTHRNAVSFYTGMDERLGKEPGIWLAVTTICFDIAGLELLWTLVRGFHVLVQAELGAAAVGRTGGGESVSQNLTRRGVTHLQATPSLYRMLLLEPEARQGLSGLRRVLVGGEALAPDLAKELREACRGEVINMYGPTETTIWSSTHRVEAEGRASTIGRPIANTRMYVLDKGGRPTPIGVAGDLFVGGEGVARGYWERPELTAERFIPDPFGAAGARMYRTGDVARYLPTGAIEYLGRSDFQVKIRGFRIELGEIEAALLAQASVHEAAVLVREDVPGDKRLVAYVVEREGAQLVPQELRVSLQKALPEYMVPSAFVILPALPLTLNGKVDRKALPAPELSSDGKEYVAPRTQVEEVLASIFAEVLRLDRVGVHGNFFELGGDSLRAWSAMARMRQELAIDIPLRAMFDDPTVEALATRVVQVRASQFDDAALRALLDEVATAPDGSTHG